MKNIQIYKGTASALNFVIRDENDNVIDLSGLTGKIKVFLNIPGQDDTYVIDKSLTIDSAIKGEVSVNLDDNDNDISVAEYQYILEFVYGVDDNRILGYGAFSILGDDIERINQIKDKYGLEYDELAMKSAFNWAHKQMLNNAFVDMEEDYKSAKDEFKIDNFVMDKNFDGVIDKNDIEIKEFMTKTPYTVNDLSSNILSVIFDHPSGKTIISMDAEYPSDGAFTVRINYKRADESYSDAIENIRRVEELYTLYHIFDKLEPYKLQRGLPSRSINGVTIDFDQDGIDRYKKKLFSEILNEIMKFRPIASRNVLVGKGY